MVAETQNNFYSCQFLQQSLFRFKQHYVVWITEFALLAHGCWKSKRFLWPLVLAPIFRYMNSSNIINLRYHVRWSCNNFITDQLTDRSAQYTHTLPSWANAFLCAAWVGVFSFVRSSICGAIVRICRDEVTICNRFLFFRFVGLTGCIHGRRFGSFCYFTVIWLLCACCRAHGREDLTHEEITKLLRSGFYVPEISSMLLKCQRFSTVHNLCSPNPEKMHKFANRSNKEAGGEEVVEELLRETDKLKWSVDVSSAFSEKRFSAVISFFCPLATSP